jgi:predicted Zn-ribbon and HTH transcriptional regulator
MTKRVYIFRTNNQLLISENGIVEKGTWEYLGNQSLLIDTCEGSYLLKHGFFDQNIIALKLDSTNNYAFFVNENKFDKELNSIEDVFKFLTIKYLKTKKNKTDKDLNKDKISKNAQKEWIKNPDRCPGCGFSGVKNKKKCPDCGLRLV